MAKIRINKDKCKGCYLCVTNCPNALIKISPDLNVKGVKAVYFSGGKPARLHGKQGQAGGCTGCTMCALICPECIIEVCKEGQGSRGSAERSEASPKGKGQG